MNSTRAVASRDRGQNGSPTKEPEPQKLDAAQVREGREQNLIKLIFGLSGLTLLPVIVVLVGSAVSFCIAAGSAATTDRSHADPRTLLLALSLGALTATSGLCAVAICLLLRLREPKNDEVLPPSLKGPIVVVALGTALAFGALFANY